jgi:peptidoglycan/xylan/chitin deacetylase (PgdA/CDA1 family)
VSGQATQLSRRRFLSGTAVGVGALLTASACAGNGTGNSPESGSAPASQAPRAAVPAGSGATPSSSAVDADLLAQRYGLKPFAAPPVPPAVKPILLDAAAPAVVSNVPVDGQKIVFLTIDDGIEKEPAFVQMVKDFQIPFTLFLTDAMINQDYGYFTGLLDTGFVTIQNHTMTHPDMTTLSASEQLDQVAQQQEHLIREYGTTPYLFRPPYGNHNDGTISAIKQTPNLKGCVLWKESMQIHDMQYQNGHLNPGDIVLSHFRGPAQLHGENMVQMMTHLFSHVQAQGYTVARLTDYV